MRLPSHKMEILQEHDKPSGFLSAHSKKVRFDYDSELSSEEMTIDYIDRKSSFDAVCIVPWYRRPQGFMVHLISCMRPAVAFRNYEATERPESESLNIWELPAGIVEENEKGMNGINSAASRELEEEVGYFVRPEYFKPLGSRVFSSVGLCGERIYFVHVEVHPQHLNRPSTDGSPLEKGSVVKELPLKEALNLIKFDQINDSKTVIGLMRLARELDIWKNY